MSALRDGLFVDEESPDIELTPDDSIDVLILLAGKAIARYKEDKNDAKNVPFVRES